jgi:hypothetical protein
MIGDLISRGKTRLCLFFLRPNWDGEQRWRVGRKDRVSAARTRERLVCLTFIDDTGDQLPLWAALWEDFSGLNELNGPISQGLAVAPEQPTWHN